MDIAGIVTGIAVAGAVVSWIVALISALRALRETRKVPGGDALARQALYNWFFVVKKMPPTAQPYVKRVWQAIGVFMLCVIAGLVVALFKTGAI